MNKKILIVIVGECFRLRNGKKGSEQSVFFQKKATSSQLDFFYNLNKKNIEIDVFLSTYSVNNDIDNLFINFYNPYLKYLQLFDSNLLGENNLIDKTIDYIKNNILFEKYDNILFIRPDHFLKKYFNDIFYLSSNKLIFCNILEICDKSANNLESTSCQSSHSLIYHLHSSEARDFINVPDSPAVNHQIFIVPKQFYHFLLNKKIWKRHFSYLKSLEVLKKEQIDFLIDTYHSACSSLTWNPIFHQVDRQESKKWPDKKYVLNKHNMKPIIFENNIIYDNIDRNEFENYISNL